MLSIAKDKIDSLFELIGSKQPLYLPVDNNSGKADFAKWQKGTKLSEKLKTTRSAKDFFFPKTEHLVSYEMSGKEVKVVDPRKDVEDFVIFGVRACDARGFTAIDNVYLNMNPVDSYYKNRREHGTVIVLACNEPAKTCFCSTFGIDASLAKPAGDVSCWLADGKYYFEANTDKGKAFVENAKSALEDADTSAVEACRKDIAEKVEKLPFAHLDLSKFQGKDMLKISTRKYGTRFLSHALAAEPALTSARPACASTCATSPQATACVRSAAGIPACTTTSPRWPPRIRATPRRKEAARDSCTSSCTILWRMTECSAALAADGALRTAL